MFSPIGSLSAWRCGALALASLLPLSTLAQFSQDFSSSSSIGDYATATPNNGQFTSIGTGATSVTWSIVDGALQGAKSSTQAGWLDRTADLSGAPFGALALSFDFRAVDIVGGSSSGNSLLFYVGDGLPAGGGNPPTSGVHSQFAIQLNDATTDTWYLRNVASATNSAASGTTLFQQITMVVNNTGSALNYNTNGLPGTLANDSFDLWLGTTRQFAGVAATDDSVALSEFKIRFNAQTGTVQFDNFSVSAVTPIPEPSTWAAIFGAVALAGVVIARRRRAPSGSPV